ncbi:MAG: cupin domain-containing protein [bacterium]|nr:cupin domain-containing protein [bacterium]
MAESKYLKRIEELPYLNLTGDEKLPSMTHMLLTEKAMVSFIENPAGCEFPIHTHEAEQILIILEGEENHECGDDKFLMKAGDICVHPPNVPHGGVTKTGFKGIDIFCPPRTEHVEKLEQFLKEQQEKE